MPDKSYDAIIVGGGHHGTILACYLQNAGLKTVMFERQHELGGGACGEELPLPGFIQNTCAHFTRFWAHPAYTDFNLRGSYMDYALPRAPDVPNFSFLSHPIPAKTNPLGVKGCGEAGCAGSLPSVMNAVVDALSELGIRHIDMPATPHRIWQAIQQAKSTQAAE